MINRYRRAARTAAELGLGGLARFDVALPELATKDESDGEPSPGQKAPEEAPRGGGESGESEMPVPVQGFEPRLGDSKSPVLPLDDTGMKIGRTIARDPRPRPPPRRGDPRSAGARGFFSPAEAVLAQLPVVSAGHIDLDRALLGERGLRGRLSVRSRRRS